MAGDTTIDLSKVRSILCVPADNEERVRKARDRGADLVLFDLEDGVAPDRRHIAREILDRYIGPDVAVRVNPTYSSDFFYDQCYISRAGLVFVPKCNILDDVPICSNVVVLIESPTAVLRLLPELLIRPSRVAGLAFGRWDFEACIGHDCPQLVNHARGCVSLAAHASGIPCWDSPERLEYSAEAAALVARSFGFTGMGCVHPLQVDTVNRVFSPDPDWQPMPLSALSVTTTPVEAVEVT